MTPQPLRIRILLALELAPMTVRDLARCLCAPPPSVEKQVTAMSRLGAIKHRGCRKSRGGRPLNVYGIAA